MNWSHRHMVRYTMILLLMVLGSPSMNYPQSQDGEIVTSIVLKITTPKGHWGQTRIVEGEMFTIVDVNTGSGYGFVPVVRNLADRLIDVKMVEISKKGGEVKVGKEIESLGVKIGATQQASSAAFEIRVLAVARDPKDEVEQNGSTISPASLSSCCVNCWDESFCGGCSVMTDCGCCCVPKPHCCICP